MTALTPAVELGRHSAAVARERVHERARQMRRELGLPPAAAFVPEMLLVKRAGR